MPEDKSDLPPLPYWDSDRIDRLLVTWRQTVEVQQHFNDLELRLRNLALTVLTAILGGAAYAFSQHMTIPADHLTLPMWSVGVLLVVLWLLGMHIGLEKTPWWMVVATVGSGVVFVILAVEYRWGSLRPFTSDVSVAAVVILVGMLVWFDFYLMDRMWYHRLLYGAVKQGMTIEDRLSRVLPEAKLTHRIGEESPIVVARYRVKMRSPHKVDFFYSVVGFVLLLLLFVSF